MTPDEIRDFLAQEYPTIVASSRSDGWSFYYSHQSPGNRIITATRATPTSGTRLLRAISFRRGNVLGFCCFDGSEEQLKFLVDEEIALYLHPFSGDATNEELNEAEYQLAEQGAFDPTGIEDARERVLSSIVRRRGRSAFRNALLERYGGHCLVTGCIVEAVLEAAHIVPYQGHATNHPDNGLLLRADIHALFDLDLLGIEPRSLRIELHPEVCEGYANFVWATLGCAGNNRPSEVALRQRYQQFQARSAQPL